MDSTRSRSPETVDAATWFEASVARQGSSETFASRGSHLHVLKWNWSSSQLPAVLLVHGHLAHAHWWDAIAAELASHFRVAALDMSGMGDSGPRASYPPEWPAFDIIDAIEHLAIGPAAIVGHSYGGSRACLAAGLRPDLVARVVALDSYFNFPDELPAQGRPAGPGRAYASVEEALERLRFRPDNVEVPIYSRRHIVRHGLRRTEDGWRWKFAAEVAARDEADGLAILRAVRASVDYVHGAESSLVSESRARRIVEVLGEAAPARLHCMPNGHHHFVLQHPQQTAQLLQRLLAG